jgi:transposase-like protein
MLRLKSRCQLSPDLFALAVVGVCSANLLHKWVRDERRRMAAAGGGGSDPGGGEQLSPEERVELVRLRALVAEQSKHIGTAVVGADARVSRFPDLPVPGKRLRMRTEGVQGSPTGLPRPTGTDMLRQDDDQEDPLMTPAIANGPSAAWAFVNPAAVCANAIRYL